MRQGLALIAVTQRVDVHLNRNERRDGLDQRWYAFVEACDGVVAPMPNRPETAAALVEKLRPNAIVLTGGNDLADLGGDAPERDASERALCEWAATRGVPVLGVCRGMQMLAHSFGGTLQRTTGHAGTRHAVNFDGGCQMVNSYHNWCLYQPPPDFAVVARAGDGTIEAMRHCSKPIMGVMWHPERETPFAASDIAVMKGLLKST
jgi:gamma-glutamyl-gamma-aminobutyrate hydrolase PuuD